LTVEEILPRLEGVKGGNGQYSARCPAHDDKRASLSVSTGEDGRILLHCHAGCTVPEILDAVGLKESDLFQKEARGTPCRPQQARPKVVARYNYTDAQGRFLFQKTRDENKGFSWSHKENGRWTKGRGGDPVLYNLPAIAGAKCLYIVEGEKDVETLKALHIPAVCGADGAGAGKWKPQYTEALKGKRVAVIQDNDDIGKAFAAETANALHGAAASVRVLDLTTIWPELPEHGDTTDLVEHFGKEGIDKIQQLAKDTMEWAFVPFDPFVPSNGTGKAEPFAPFAPFAPPNANRLPAFPVECLPPALGKYVQAVADNIQVSADMAAVSALTVCAVCVQRKFIVNPKPGWVEPLNLYAVIVAKPSERKSPVMKAMTRYLYEYAKEENERRAPEIEAYRTQRDILESAIASLMGSKAKDDGNKLENILDKKRELRELKPVRPLRLLADDVTTEALTSLIADNGGKMAVVSAEGGIFETLSGMYSNKVNIDAVLKAYSGDYIQVDRKGRPPESIDHPALTILLFIQILVLNDIMGNDIFKGRGMLARFLYCIPQSVVGHRVYETQAIEPATERDYENLLYSLLSIREPEKAEAIRLSDEAAALSKSFFEELEPRLVDDLEEIDDWAGKYHGQVIRIAGILHCCIHGEDAAAELVSGGTMQNAITIGRYFLEHAKAAFLLMGLGESQDVKDAKYILKRIDSTGQTEISKRDLYRLCDSHFPSIELMEPILNLLIDHGYIRMEKVKTGGRPTEKVILSPEYERQKGQNRQKPAKWVYNAELGADILED
jgi:primase 1